MAEADWTLVDSSLAATQVARGVSAGFTPPLSGGSYVFGFNSLTSATGMVGFWLNRTNFGPLLNAGALATGGSIRFAVKRAPSTGATGFAPFGFMCLRAGAAASPNPAAADLGYLMGLEDAEPHRIVFRKGAPSLGLPATAGSSLRASTASFSNDTWLHLRMDVIVNPNGDVVVRFFRSTLGGAVTVVAPTWAAIPGMTDFVDDALGVNSGSSPLSGGFAGWAFWSNQAGRRAYVDHVQVLRQV